MERRSARNLTINTTGGCRGNPRICAVKKSATNFCEGILGRRWGISRTEQRARRWEDAEASCLLVSCHHTVNISPSDSVNQRLIEEIFSGLQMKRILDTSSCIRQLIRESGSKQLLLDSESKAAAFSFRIPHVFSINYFPGQSGPLKGDTE
jgi:hypothetical protein